MTAEVVLSSVACLLNGGFDGDLEFLYFVFILRSPLQVFYHFNFVTKFNDIAGSFH